MAFEAIDTELYPEANQELKRFGIPRVPAVVVGDRAVHGWNPQGVAELVGVDYQEDAALSAEELGERLQTLLSLAQTAIRQVPPSRLTLKTPGRDRTVRQLGYHIFRVAKSFPDAQEQGFLPDSWFEESPPTELTDGATIAKFGDTVRARLREWLERPEVFQGEVDTYYGSQTAMAFFERTVWHVAQHVRQLYALLEEMGVTPETPLHEAVLQGLPLPRDVW